MVFANAFFLTIPTNPQVGHTWFLARLLSFTEPPCVFLTQPGSDLESSLPAPLNGMQQAPAQEPQLGSATALPRPASNVDWVEGGFYNDSIWPSEPDEFIIRAIAAECLASQIPGVSQEAVASGLSVAFLAAGAMRRVYTIQHPRLSKTYLFGAVLHIDPRLHTESEVATTKFVRSVTEIPVPNIIAWNSSTRNALGYEWTLAEKAEGVTLDSVWRKMPWSAKIKVVTTLASYAAQLSDYRFDQIGSLYLNSAHKHVINHPQASATWHRSLPPQASPNMRPGTGNISTHHTDQRLFTAGLCTSPNEPQDFEQTQIDFEPVRSAHDFFVGPMVDQFSFWGDFRYVPSNRGPYASEAIWLRAKADVCRAYVSLAQVFMNEDTDFSRTLRHTEYDLPYVPEAANALNRLERSLLRLFPKRDDNNPDSSTPFMIQHTDLSLGRIMVDPQTFEVTAIVDWGMAQIVPKWKAFDYPAHLKNEEPTDTRTPPLPDYDRENEGYGEDRAYNYVAIMLQDQLNGRKLHIVFDKARDLYGLGRPSYAPDRVRCKLETDFEEFQESWGRGAYCINRDLDELCACKAMLEGRNMTDCPQ